MLCKCPGEWREPVLREELRPRLGDPVKMKLLRGGGRKKRRENMSRNRGKRKSRRRSKGKHEGGECVMCTEDRNIKVQGETTKS